MSYSELTALFTALFKALGVNQPPEWVIGVMAVVVLAVVGVIIWLIKKPKQPPPSPAPSSPTSNEAHGSVGQQIGGSGHTINQSVTPEILDRLSEKDQKIGQLSEKNAQQEARIKELERPLEEDPEIQKLQREGEATGDVATLRDLEQQAAQAAQPLRDRAAQFALQQGALLLGRDMKGAYGAFERAHEYDPRNLLTLRWLTELSPVVLGSLDEANHWAIKALDVAEDQAHSDPANNNWQRDLAISYASMARILQAQDQREQALEFDQESLVISKKLADSDPNNIQWQVELATSYLAHAGNEQSGPKKVDWYDKALDVLKGLDKQGVLPTAQKDWIPIVVNERERAVSSALPESARNDE